MTFWHEWRGHFDGTVVMWIRNLFRFSGWRVDLHKFVAADMEGCFHSHPARAFRIVLRGGYIEELYGKRGLEELRVCGPGFFGFVYPETVHRIDHLLNGPSWSLWIRWPKTHEVKLLGDGWAREETRHG
ncbi:hypothetical protein [Hyphobacterium sp.]|uniref:hypothetical protein n=1 Tax=Hyphobacterium sp. TaxID=2004662 RepID=UPI003BA94A13